MNKPTSIHGDADTDPVLIENAEDAAEDSAEVFNDATLYGAETPEYLAALQKPFPHTVGRQFTGNKKGSTVPGEWKPVELSLAQAINGQQAANKNSRTWGLSRHPVAKDKDGDCIIFGHSLGGQRKAKAMTAMSAMALDVDSGASFDAIRKKVEEMGLFAILYTSFSHTKTHLDLKRDEVIKKVKISGEPTLAQIREYLAWHDKNAWDGNFVNAVEIENAKLHTEDGMLIRLKTPPQEKFRLVFPLAETITITDLSDTHQGALKVWEDKITGLAVKMLCIPLDTSCTDPSRLFFTPRHAEGKEHKTAIVRGRPLSFAEVPTMSKALYLAQRGNKDPFALAGMGGEGPEGEKAAPMVLAPSGRILNEWHSKIGKERFLLADMLEALCDDKRVHVPSEKSDTIHVECPFEGEHSNAGGSACMASNPDANPHGYYSWACLHDSCRGKHKLEFIAKALEDGWFAEDELFNQEWLLPAYEDETEDDDDGEVIEDKKDQVLEFIFDPTPGAPSEENQRRMQGLNAASADDDVRKALRRILKDPANLDNHAEMARVKAWIAGRTPLKLGGRRGGLDWLVKDVQSQIEKDAEEQRQKSRRPDDGDISVSSDDFKDQVRRVRARLTAANATSPFLFGVSDGVDDHYATILSGSAGMARVSRLSEGGLAHQINQQCTFFRESDKMGSIGVSCPLDVVKDIYNAPKHWVPRLAGVRDTPFFDRAGNLVVERGYHAESGIYLCPPSGLVIPAVSIAPDETEVLRAKRLLVEEVLADFPLGGVSRADIVQAGVAGDGVNASLCHALAAMILPFCREMIEGPCPGVLYNKPRPGTGASLMVEVTSLITMGEEAAPQSLPGNEEEMVKVLVAALSDGHPIVYFDNITKGVVSPQLAAAMTSTTYRGRILGKSQIAAAAVRCVWLLTGNNLEVSAELFRRMIGVELDTGQNNPKARTGFRHRDLKAWVRQNRGDLIWAVLTLIQNWIAKDRPAGDYSLPSFEAWAAVVPGIVKTAGIAGFGLNAAEMSEAVADGTEDAELRLLQRLDSLPSGKKIGVGPKVEGADISLLDLLNDQAKNDAEGPIRLNGWGYTPPRMRSDDSIDHGSYSDAKKVGRMFARFTGTNTPPSPKSGTTTREGTEFSFDRAEGGKVKMRLDAAPNRKGVMIYTLLKEDVGQEGGEGG